MKELISSDRRKARFCVQCRQICKYGFGRVCSFASHFFYVSMKQKKESWFQVKQYPHDVEKVPKSTWYTLEMSGAKFAQVRGPDFLTRLETMLMQQRQSGSSYVSDEDMSLNIFSGQHDSWYYPGKYLLKCRLPLSPRCFLSGISLHPSNVTVLHHRHVYQSWSWRLIQAQWILLS